MARRARKVAPADPVFYVERGVGGTIVWDNPPAPVKQGPGQDCARWRRLLAAGKPLTTRRAGRGAPSFAATLRQTNVRGTRIRVRCPSCARSILLRAWWDHGCSKPIVQTTRLGDFAEVTAGAAAPDVSWAA